MSGLAEAKTDFLSLVGGISTDPSNIQYRQSLFHFHTRYPEQYLEQIARHAVACGYPQLVVDSVAMQLSMFRLYEKSRSDYARC